ncbi:MAG: putative DNA binding domain-containing protein [Bacteroidales bacterium]|nr:putative DNA binding domain-containing protein [Bacteroidales bacterium]
MNAENQNIEYKESWRDEYLKWICGFANAQGGKLYIGIDDSGNVCGVKDAHRLSEDIPNKIVALLGIVADVNVHSKGGKEYIEIDVAPSNVPISLKGVYHYRSGSTKQELNGIALQQFVLKKLGRTWDDIICEQATINDIDRKAIDYFLRKSVDAQRLPEESLNSSTEDVLKNLHLMDSDGKLKNAAILLFGKCPQDFITGVYFKIGFFGKDDTDLIFQDLVEGNILKMCDTVIKILKAKYLISPIHYEGLQRIEPLEIPEDAFREAIFNSIIHKDYMGVAIQMKVWRDRIELWNYGRLPEELTIAKLHEPHASNARNKNIAFAFYKAGFIEAWGRGISKIVTQFTAAGLKEPKFEDFCGGVRVTIYRNTDLVAETIEKNDGEVSKRVTVNDEEVTKKIVEGVTVNAKGVTVNEENAQKSTQKNNGEVVDNGVGGIVKGIDKIDEGAQKSAQKTDYGVTVNEEGVTENQKVILDEIEKNARITAQQLAEILHISLRKTKKHIAKLKLKGLIQRIGPDKGGHWEIIKQNNNN